jgi:magnesium-transporting ATPase (P-type)
MKINQISVQAALASLDTSPRGLTEREAARRLAEYGANRLEQIQPEPLWRRLLRQFTGFFALILWLAAALAFVAEWRDPNSGMALLAEAIVAVIVINGIFSFWQEYRAERAIAALRRLLPAHTTVLRNGVAVQLTARHIVPATSFCCRKATRSRPTAA